MTLRVDFTSQEYLRDPAAALRWLRASGPVVQTKFPIIGKVWITTTQEMAGRVLKDSQTFTLRKNGGGPAGLRWWMPPTLRSLANNMLSGRTGPHAIAPNRRRGLSPPRHPRDGAAHPCPRGRACRRAVRGGQPGGSRRALRAKAAARRHLRAARPAVRRQGELRRLGEPGGPHCWAGRPDPHACGAVEHEALPGAAPGGLPPNRW
jgi:hypothetical protein